MASGLQDADADAGQKCDHRGGGSQGPSEGRGDRREVDLAQSRYRGHQRTDDRLRRREQVAGQPEGGQLAIRPSMVLLDPTLRWTVTKEALRSKSHNTPLLGREVTGRVRMTLAGGEIVWQT